MHYTLYSAAVQSSIKMHALTQVLNIQSDWTDPFHNIHLQSVNSAMSSDHISLRQASADGLGAQCSKSTTINTLSNTLIQQRRLSSEVSHGLHHWANALKISNGEKALTSVHPLRPY